MSRTTCNSRDAADPLMVLISRCPSMEALQRRYPPAFPKARATTVWARRISRSTPQLSCRWPIWLPLLRSSDTLWPSKLVFPKRIQLDRCHPRCLPRMSPWTILRCLPRFAAHLARRPRLCWSPVQEGQLRSGRLYRRFLFKVGLPLFFRHLFEHFNL